MISLIAATGLRIGELLGLRWRALDLDIGTLAVRGSVFEGHVQAPKTQKAVRTIPLGPHALATLAAHRQRVSRRAPEDLVFGKPTLRLLCPRVSSSTCSVTAAIASLPNR